jgi:imidazolonepropionase-like amidohydrolase
MVMKKLITFIAALLLVPVSAFAASSAVRYTVLLAGNKAGFATSTRNADGSFLLHYEYNDRGRGPNVNERIVLDKNGIPVEIENTGVDYLKAPVEEHFFLKEGKAVWKNRAEQGGRDIPDPAFYISISGAPEEGAILARALLKAKDGLRLLPAGKATIEKRGELKVQAGGNSRSVLQYAVSGLDFSPSPIWLDRDGTFFAYASSWFAVVLEGWEPAVDALLKAQDELDNRRAAELVKSVGHKPSGPFAFVHANLFDTETLTSRPRSTVLFTGNRITAVGDDGAVKLPPGTEIMDITGQTVMPGLWDMHVHLSPPNDGILDLSAGVTTVRDMANDTDRLLEMKRHFDDGSWIGPRVLMAGFLDGRGPYAGPTKVFADNEEEARKAVDNYAKLGYSQIKIYSSIKPELVPKIAEMGHSHGLRVSGHVPAFMTAEQFVKDGADEIQHMNFIFLNFMFDRVKDTRTPARFTEVAAHGAEIDPDSPQVKAFIDLLKEHKTVLDPTLNVFEGMFTDRPGKLSAVFAPIASRVPAQIRRGFFYGGLDVPEGMDQRYQDSFRQMLKMTKTLYDAGVPIVAGTDSLAGYALHRELELYVQAGIPAPNVLQLATLGAARVMKQDKDFGSVVPGKYADLIVIDGDPTQNIAEIRHISSVVKDGVLYRTPPLAATVSVTP